MPWLWAGIIGKAVKLWLWEGVPDIVIESGMICPEANLQLPVASACDCVVVILLASLVGVLLPALAVARVV